MYHCELLWGWETDSTFKLKRNTHPKVMMLWHILQNALLHQYPQLHSPRFLTHY